MRKKYKLLPNETIEYEGRTLFRIEALIDFGTVAKGAKGGFIEKEENLSHEGNAWVYDGAYVYGNAQIFGNTCVYGNVCVYGDVRIYANTGDIFSRDET